MASGEGPLEEVCAVGCSVAAPSSPPAPQAHSRWLPMAEEGTPPPEAELRAELAAMKVKALKKRAKEAGVDEEKIEDADDAHDVKSTVIELIVAAERGATLEKLRAELSAMKVTALKKRAKEVGVDEEKLEDADDEKYVKRKKRRRLGARAFAEPWI